LRIIGIDPGLSCTGYGVVDSSNNNLETVDFGVIKTDSKDSLSRRLKTIYSDVKEIIGEDIKIINTKSDDNRSYHVSSEKIKEVLGFETRYTVKNAVSDLKNAFEKKLLINTFDNEFFFNIKRMNNLKLK